MSYARQPLDTVLGSVANVRVMRALVRNGGPLSVRRLADETRITPNGVRDALRSLEWAGLSTPWGRDGPGCSWHLLKIPSSPQSNSCAMSSEGPSRRLRNAV